MNIDMQRLGTLLVLLGSLLVAPPSRGEDADAPADTPTDEPTAWTCSTCLYPVGWTGSYDVGADIAFGVTPWAGRYTGLYKNTVYPVLDANLLLLEEDGGRWEFIARDLGLDSRSLSLVHRRPGDHRYAVEYRAIPSLAAEGTRTPFAGVGSSTLTLPPGWVRGDATTDMTLLPGALQPVEIGTERERVGASATWFERRGFTTDLRAATETKRGTDPMGASLITRSTILPEPVDQVTDSFEAGLGYKTGPWNVEARYRLATFRNAVESVTWDVPFTALNPAATQGRMALAPDNDFQQFGVDGSWRGAGGLKLNASVSIGQGSQDAALLPTSITPGLAIALPRATAAMDVDTTLAYLRASWPVSHDLALRGELRYDERDATAPLDLFPQVVTDTYLAPSRSSVVNDYAKTLARIEGDWRFSDLRLLVRGQRLITDRDQGSVARNDEDSISAELRGPMFGVLEGSLEVAHDRRGASPFVPLAGPAPQNPALRYTNMAPMQRDRWSASISAAPSERVSFELRIDGRIEDYAATEVGLTDHDDTGFGADLNWIAAEDIAVALYFQHQTLGYQQAGSQGFAAADWSALSEDATDAVGLELDAPYLTENLGLRAELALTESSGQVDVTTGSVDSFPEVSSHLMLIRIEGRLRISERYTLLLGWRHERFDSSDWAITGVAPDTVPGVLGLGEIDPNYEMDIFELTLHITL